MKIVTYRITLREPVLVTALEGDPNSAVSYDFLPGAALRGGAIGLAMRKNKQSELKIDDSAVRRRFFDSRTRFLNGYLVINGQRSLPAPRSWEQDKHAEDATKITDRVFTLIRELNQSPTSEDDTKKPVGKVKSLGGKFTVSVEDGGAAYLAEPTHVINVHTERNRTKGRSLGGNSGTIYRYDALAAGQIFEAMILCDDDNDADYFKDLLEKSLEITLGGARSAGYGRVSLSDVNVHNSYREAGAGSESDLQPEQVILTLLSDVILRDANGQYRPDAHTLCGAIAAQLGISPDNIQITAVFKGEGMVGGFNRKWGLPLPQAPIITMGSVFVLTLKVHVAENQFEMLEWNGIGERRAEGFGRVAVNWQRHETLVKEPIPKSEVQKQISWGDPESQQIWAFMEARLVRQKTDKEQIAEANKLDIQLNKLPTSQINRLRQIVVAELVNQADGYTAINEFLSDINGKKAGKHFERARVDGQPMSEWLAGKAQSSDKYATLRLLDAALARAAKKAQSEEANKKAING